MLTKDQIKFLNRVCTGRWTETNGVISVEVDVDMEHMNLTQIPVYFGRVNGYFDCSYNTLTTLKGSPSIIEGDFNCNINQLTTLEGGPKEVGEYYSCGINRLTTLIGAPNVCDNFTCDYNRLTSLQGCPLVIRGNFQCLNNPDLKYLWGIGRVEGNVYYDNRNEINQWIISSARKDIIFPHFTLEENINWIKHEQKYSCLLDAPDEIRKQFSPRITHLVDMGSYNESRILDYKKFSSLC